MQQNLGQMAQVIDKSPRNRKSVAVSACGLRVWRTDATPQLFATLDEEKRETKTKTKRNGKRPVKKTHSNWWIGKQGGIIGNKNLEQAPPRLLWGLVPTN